jgi:hypothetical protein
MSKRCELQKKYYKKYGNYKGEGKYSDHYVKWLEDIVICNVPDSKTQMNKEQQQQALIDMMQADEKDGLYNKAIPTLEGDEAEEFIRKADEALKAEKTDWTLQSKRAERILEKSRIANRKLRYTKSDTPNVKRSKDVEP